MRALFPEFFGLAFLFNGYLALILAAVLGIAAGSAGGP